MVFRPAVNPGTGSSWTLCRGANNLRNPAISVELRAHLREYLEFRHVFRQAYAFQLRWEKMRALVLGREETLRLLEAELERFLRTGPANG